eukprot:scaffold18019_cov118-Isochrysis_galbana.AAC.4
MALVIYSCALCFQSGIRGPVAVPHSVPQKPLKRSLLDDVLVIPMMAVTAALASHTPTSRRGRESIFPADTRASPTELTSRSCSSCAGVSGGGETTVPSWLESRSSPLISTGSPRNPRCVELASQKLVHAVPFQEHAHLVALYLQAGG